MLYNLENIFRNSEKYLFISFNFIWSAPTHEQIIVCVFQTPNRYQKNKGTESFEIRRLVREKGKRYIYNILFCLQSSLLTATENFEISSFFVHIQCMFILFLITHVVPNTCTCTVALVFSQNNTPVHRILPIIFHCSLAFSVLIEIRHTCEQEAHTKDL